MSISTATAGATRPISRVASMPFMSGIRMSITTTCGRSVTAARTASRPPEATPTTDTPGVPSRTDSNSAASPVRTTG